MKKLLFFTASMLSSALYAQDSIEVKLNKANCNFNQGVTQLQQKGWAISEFYNANTNTLFITNPAIKSLLNVTIDSVNIDSLDSSAESTFISSQLTCFTYERIEVEPTLFFDVSPTQGTYYNNVQAMRQDVGISEANRYSTAQNAINPISVVMMDKYPIYKDFNYTNLHDVVQTPWVNPYSDSVPRTSVVYHASAIAEVVNSMGQFKIYSGDADMNGNKKEVNVTELVDGIDTIGNCTSSHCTPIIGSPYTWIDALPSSGGITMQQKYMDSLYDLAHNHGAVVIQSVGNNKVTPQETERWRAHYRREGIIYVSESSRNVQTGELTCLSPSTPAGTFDPDQSPLVHVTVATVSGYPRSNASHASGSSGAGAVVTGIAANIKGFNWHMSNHEINESIINSTKIYNNTSTKDVCKGYGEVNADAAMNYAKYNFPNATWARLWEERTYYAINESSFHPSITLAFKDKCLRLGLKYRTNFSNELRCDATPSTPEIDSFPILIYQDVGYPYTDTVFFRAYP